MIELLSVLSALAGFPYPDLDVHGDSKTPVVVTVLHGELPEPEAMQGWFAAGEEPLRVVRVERGPAEVVVVRDPAAQAHLDLLAKGLLDSELERLAQPRESDLADAQRSLHDAFRLEDGARVRFLSPLAAPVSHTVEPMNVFNLTHSFPAREKGFLSFVEARAPSFV